MNEFLRDKDMQTFLLTISITLGVAMIRIFTAAFVGHFTQVTEVTIELIFRGIVAAGLTFSAPFIYSRKWVKIGVTSFWAIMSGLLIYVILY